MSKQAPMSEAAIPVLVAHRGYMRRYPENTLPALEAAIDAGACWVEFDIQMCRDGRFILLHDDNFARTAGVDRSVFEMGSVGIDLSVHEPQRFADRFAPTPVATLTEVLAGLARRPATRAMVEIKQQSIEHWGLEAVMERLLGLLETHRRQCALIAYNRRALEWFRQRTSVPVGWVLQAYDDSHHARAESLRPDFLICNQAKIPGEATPWPGPWQWMLYDIIDPDQAVAWAARGVSLIETADIGAMLQDARLKQRACRHEPL
jgi:glycerophosphoryl diester phosphodiesterase